MQPDKVCGIHIPSLMEGGWEGKTVVLAVGIVGMIFRPAKSSNKHNKSSSFSPDPDLGPVPNPLVFSFSSPEKNKP